MYKYSVVSISNSFNLCEQCFGLIAVISFIKSHAKHTIFTYFISQNNIHLEDCDSFAERGFYAAMSREVQVDVTECYLMMMSI